MRRALTIARIAFSSTDRTAFTPRQLHGAANEGLGNTFSGETATWLSAHAHPTGDAQIPFSELCPSVVESIAVTPVILGSQLWELSHLTLGLPWWATIPATTWALRTVMLPLTLKAKGASANLALMQHAFSQSTAAPVSQDKSSKQALSFSSRLSLARQVYKHMRQQHGTPSLWWYSANAFLQVNTFVFLSAALREMCHVSWPGLLDGGVLYFTDLTQPAVQVAGWATPYGVAGVIMPLVLFLTYKSTVEYSAAYRSPATSAALELFGLFYFCASLIMPQATLLYWLSNATFAWASQRVLDMPSMSQRAGLPLLLWNPQTEADRAALAKLREEQTHLRISSSSDASFLSYLASQLAAAGHAELAEAAAERIRVLQPGSTQAAAAKSAAAQQAGDHSAAAAALEAAAAELRESGGPVQDQALALVGAAGAGLRHVEQNAAQLSQEEREALLLRYSALAARAVELLPTEPLAHIASAFCAAAAGKWPVAVSAAKTAASLAPDAATARQLARLMATVAGKRRCPPREAVTALTVAADLLHGTLEPSGHALAAGEAKVATPLLPSTDADELASLLSVALQAVRQSTGQEGSREDLGEPQRLAQAAVRLKPWLRRQGEGDS